MKIDDELLEELLAEAKESPRLRMNMDLRTSPEDSSQRMLNALLPGTEVPIHRHPMSNENVICLTGSLEEVLYEEVPADMPDEEDVLVAGKVRLREKERNLLDPHSHHFGIVVPAGVWHTVNVIAPSVTYEAKDGKYGEDGSESI